MKKRIWLALALAAILIASCSSPAPAPTETVPPEPTSIPPTDTPAPTPTIDPETIQAVLREILPADEGFFKHCVKYDPFPVWNGMIGEFFGVEYETLLDEMGRIVGVASHYECTPENTTPQIFIIVETFEDEAGAVEFFNYDFPPEFRQYNFESQEIDIPGADQARIRWQYELEGYEEDFFKVMVEFQTADLVGIIHTTGILDNFPAATAKTGARFIVENYYK